jgi:predicted unusual protein kinase regulating ubiquinone biosynthesis (AarF/ABC1/UbiB family)
VQSARRTVSAPRTLSIGRVLPAAAVGAVATLFLIRRRRDPTKLRAPIRAKSRAGRSVQLAAVGSRAGSTYAMHRARMVFAKAERREELDVRYQLRTAEQVADALGHMKGAVMKLGQMASYLDQGLPEPVRDVLAQLQQDAPSMAPELAARVVTEELGSSPETLFAEWDPTPIAAASIGQVHRAMTHDGRAVAVKVQYPGINEAIRGDLDSAGLLFQAMTLLFPGLEPGPIVEELRARLIEEVDYGLEAANQRLFAEFYADHPFIDVPRVVDEWCSARVITTDLAEGVRYSELLTWPQHERDLAAETIYRYVFGSIYRLHAFNGDPHPGNYLFRPGGRVAFLDYGLVKRFGQAELSVFEDMITKWAIEHDVSGFRKVVERVGFLKPGQPFTDEEVGAYFGHFYEFVDTDQEMTMDEAYASETVRRFFDASGPFADIMRAANLPPGMVIIQRINLGLYAILGELRATANWRRIAEELWPFAEQAPSTDLGRREAAWLAEYQPVGLVAGPTPPVPMPSRE